MKKIVSVLCMLGLAILLIAGATLEREQSRVPAPKRCVGYTVIAVNKGVDCNGDTITLVKQHGYFQFVSKLGD